MKTEYSEDQFHTNYPDGVENHWWNLARNRVIDRIVTGIGGSEGAKILDVGCGRGIVVGYLRNHGIDCTGVEVGDARPMAAAEGRVRSGISALALPMEERMTYDAILLLDVIEHLPEPVQFMQSLVHAFPKLSHMIVTVPARQELWSNYDEHYGHYRRYSLHDLENLAGELRADVVDKRYFFHSVYPLALLGAKLGRKREVNIAVPKGMAAWIHKAVASVLVADSMLVPGAVHGTSAYACYRLDRNAGAGVG